MSALLDSMERMAGNKIIIRHDEIEGIMELILARKLKTFSAEKFYYGILRDHLTAGFDISGDKLDELSIADILAIIGYEPGNTGYDVPKFGKKKLPYKFNSAASCRFLSMMLQNVARSGDIHVKQFMNISILELSCYAGERLADRVSREKLSGTSVYKMGRDLENFERNVRSYMHMSEEDMPQLVTIGDLLSTAIAESIRGWVCVSEELGMYATRQIANYDILGRLFMDVIRMHMVTGADREWFKDVITSLSDCPEENLKSIDFDKCYEPS